MSLGMILLIVLILLLLGAFPSWGYSRNWGYGPSGGLGLVLVIVLILVLLGASKVSWIRSSRGGHIKILLVAKPGGGARPGEHQSFP